MRAVAALAAFTAALALAAPAHAEGQDAYLAYLLEHGFTAIGSEWASQAVAEGKIACGKLREGYSEINVASGELTQMFGPFKAAALVEGAHLYLCPEA